MPQSIPKGLTRECILQALADLAAGIEHPFGPPTGYELVHEGKRYPPKAIIGLACRSLLGRILLPEEFSGGEAPGLFAGLNVLPKKSYATDYSYRTLRTHQQALLSRWVAALAPVLFP